MDLSIAVRLTGKRALILWSLFFFICLGLGYPTLNRYDPRTVGGTSDSTVYYDVIVGTPPPPPLYDRDQRIDYRNNPATNYYRVLIPWVAKPFYRLARGRVGTWDPVFFGMLIANGIFSATAALVLVAVGLQIVGEHTIALLAALLFLSNFTIANMNQSAHIDSGESCFMMLVAWTLLQKRLPLLPIWGVLGALAKETFAPLAVIFALGWWLAEDRSRAQLLWIAALAISSLATVTVAMSTVSGGLIWPWQFAVAMATGPGSPSVFLMAFLHGLTDRVFLFTFLWLLPLGALRLRAMPRPWVIAASLASFAALLMGAHNDAQGNTARACFNVAAPLLSLSAAVLLAEIKTTAR